MYLSRGREKGEMEPGNVAWESGHLKGRPRPSDPRHPDEDLLGNPLVRHPR